MWPHKCFGHQAVICTHLHYNNSPRSWPKERIAKLLVDLCNELDEDFLTEHDCPDGSTAIIALVLGTDVFIANVGRPMELRCWLYYLWCFHGKGVGNHLHQQYQWNWSGDSSGVLSGEVATPFTFPDHKPGAAVERKRISEAGPLIVYTFPAGCLTWRTPIEIVRIDSLGAAASV